MSKQKYCPTDKAGGHRRAHRPTPQGINSLAGQRTGSQATTQSSTVPYNGKQARRPIPQDNKQAHRPTSQGSAVSQDNKRARRPPRRVQQSRRTTDGLAGQPRRVQQSRRTTDRLAGQPRRVSTIPQDNKRPPCGRGGEEEWRKDDEIMDK